MRFFLLLLLIGYAPLSARTTSLFGIGYRYDHQEFDFSTADCDPLSHLDWRQLQAVQFLLTPDWECNRIHIAGSAALGIIYSGEFIDTDWRCMDGLHQLWSRTHSQVTGYNYDFDLGVGRDFLFAYCFQLRPLIGFAYHQQYYRLWGLCQEIDPESYPYVADDYMIGTFRSEWLAGWVGASGDLYFLDCWQLLLRARFYIGGHRSYGDWRLRPELRAGKGWSNVARAYGVEASAYLAAWVCGGGAFTIGAQYRNFWTGPGDHYTHAANGACLMTRLRRVQWDSIQGTLGFIFKY